MRVAECFERSAILSEFRLNVDKTLHYYGRILVRAARSGLWGLQRISADRPVFVVGCSRAGTTLVYKTLGESPVLGTLNRETHDFWAELHSPAEKNWDTHALTAADASDADREAVTRYFYTCTSKRRWVDKNNQNGLCVPYLHALFPDASFVYVKRSPGDNLNSLIEGWGKEGKFSTWSEDLPAKVEIDEGRYTRWCFFLANGWREYLRAPVEDVAAFQYRAINCAILDAKAAIPEKQWDVVFYEDLVRDQVAGFCRVFEACGFEFDAKVEAHCQGVLETPYDAFCKIKLDKWKESHNRERVERALPRVTEIARRMGYQQA